MNDTEFYVEMLKSNECQCGRTKSSGHSVCHHCYSRLPEDMQKSLYKKIGHGLEDAYEAAVEFLS